ncbi:hypothetical protein B0A48_08307 [Cryoendolithus antarcticus]|uniref:Major facilitator superfamily (MFS) profile domain-containing protein n=1 Tax=Cryoendolithus antarcticus TaxID=1507870 RepID=A0A1V8T5F1_9PEZI|nr:hypothetical protein B0A48_08307 [Cryoendolithus antarcticus]
MAALRPLTWLYNESGLDAVRLTGRDAVRTELESGSVTSLTSIPSALFFAELGYSDSRIGLFFTLTLGGDVIVGILLTLVADRLGRRRVLWMGSALMIASGLVFAYCENFWLLLIAAIVGVVSTMGGDFGPFRAIEESILSQLTTPQTRPDVLAWYVTISTWGSSVGSEISGRTVEALSVQREWSLVNSYHILFLGYAIMGLVNAGMMLLLSNACEVDAAPSAYKEVAQADEADDDSGIELDDHNLPPETRHKRTPSALPVLTNEGSWLSKWFSAISGPTRSIMYRLWFLLAADSVADGMVPYTYCNYFLDQNSHPSKSTLGDITSISYLLAAMSSVFAGTLSRRIGLINTMVFTHVPSSAAVLLFGLSSRLWVNVILLFIRAGLNNMDQAPRAAFIAAVVKPEERTAVMGITSTIRTMAAMIGPSITGLLASGDRFWLAFTVAGALRLAYDFGLYSMFVNMKLHTHEQTPANAEVTVERRLLLAQESTITVIADLLCDNVDREGARLVIHPLGTEQWNAIVTPGDGRRPTPR